MRICQLQCRHIYTNSHPPILGKESSSTSRLLYMPSQAHERAAARTLLLKYFSNLLYPPLPRIGRQYGSRKRHPTIHLQLAAHCNAPAAAAASSGSREVADDRHLQPQWRIKNEHHDQTECSLFFIFVEDIFTSGGPIKSAFPGQSYGKEWRHRVTDTPQWRWDSSASHQLLTIAIRERGRNSNLKGNLFIPLSQPTLRLATTTIQDKFHRMTLHFHYRYPPLFLRIMWHRRVLAPGATDNLR